MSQGDVWQTKDGRKGLEMRRNEKELMLSIMREDWPFPDYPQWFKKTDCKKLPSRYHGGEVLEEALL
ncbi:hypothetical protein [Caudoviricetes sp.]|nr:hypothetical protein [Caudoviricetes sp.]